MLVPDHPIARHVAAVLTRKEDFALAVLDSSEAAPISEPAARSTLPVLASDLDAATSERRATVRARAFRLALPEPTPDLAERIDREAEACVRRGALSRSETAALAGLLPGAREGLPMALASAQALIWKV